MNENENEMISDEELDNAENNIKPASRDELIDGLMRDVVGPESVPDDNVLPITNTIKGILHDYHLSTDMSFIEKIAKISFPKTNEKLSIDEIPRELQDAAFLPVNTLTDIALRQDIDMLISQIPEWSVAATLARDSICEADVVDGKIARTIKFDNEKLADSEDNEYLHIMSKIEDVEERLELDAKIKYDVRDALVYGEGGYEYTVPYAKVFADLYKYRINNKDAKQAQLFDTTTSLLGYSSYGEAAEISLTDTIIQEHQTSKRGKKSEVIREQMLFTEQEIMEINPSYHSSKSTPDETSKQKEQDKLFDEYLAMVSDNIRYIDGGISVPVVEESAFDLEAAYRIKYQEMHANDVNKVKTIFESVMDSNHGNDEMMQSLVPSEFVNVKGVYTRSLPSTKVIPIRIDRTIVGYYYVSDKTRPDTNGNRKNTALTGYTLRSPSIAQDTFSPEQMFYEKLASKIINNFDLKFMRDNVALHQQIVTILEAHNFNEAMLRFVFIPAEYVINFAINKDGTGRGHSMFEDGLPVARMYMFLKLYSLLYQINNSQIRVYNMRTSGIDKNIKQFTQDAMRKFMDRRVTPNDIFNYRSSMTKVTGCSELVMPVGPSGVPPITVEAIPAAEAPLSTELMESLKNEAVNAQPVPSAMLQGAMSELEFAKEVELANTKLNSFTASCKIDLNPDITRFYKRILRWETDIDESILATLKYTLKMPAIKHGSITTEMINNFTAVADVVVSIWLDKKERGDDNDSQVARELKKLLLADYVPDIDTVHIDELVNVARDHNNADILDKINDKENIVGDGEEAGADELEGV